MKILNGIKDGALLQRDGSGFCRCVFKAISCGDVRSDKGKTEKTGEDEYILSGIPAGGPYDIELYDDSDCIKLKIWVGDLWILAGQSNMEGAGCVNCEVEKETESSQEYVRSYYLDGRWDKAVPVLHEPWLSPDERIGGVWRKQRRESLWQSEEPGSYQGNPVKLRAVGPGYYFAKRMYEITGVPQAVIPCALGGTSLDDWRKDENNDANLYGVMLRRFKETGSNMKGIFWDQGEAEASEGNDFTGKMIKFIADIRKDTLIGSLPVVQVQIAKCAVPAICSNVKSGMEWSRIKEEQRLLERHIPFLTMVSAVDADFDDMIHYSSDFQRKMGIRAADAMAKLTGDGGSEPPYPAEITYRKNNEYSPFFHIYDIRYENAEFLKAFGVPTGFMVLGPEDDIKNIFNPETGVQKVVINKNVISLYTEIKENPEDVRIYYGFGHMAHCNITSDTGFSIPAMGPVSPDNI